MGLRLLLDTSSLAYRAFYALPTSITDDAGQPVNAVRGYLDMTARLLTGHWPTDGSSIEALHVLDDDWRPAPRVAAYAGYKSERADEPEELTPQFALIRQVLALLGQRVAWAPGWEADDAIGALCAGRPHDLRSASAGEQATRVDVVTGDRDLLQLVGEGVRVLFTTRGVSDLTVFDSDTVVERYGIPPERYVDYATLRGDPSDGLPGVRGVGEKTAVDLVGRYGDLDALVEAATATRQGRQDAADGLSPKLAERIEEARDYLAAMHQVVPVRADVHVEVDAGERDDRALDELATARRIDGPVGRLRDALDGVAGSR